MATPSTNPVTIARVAAGLWDLQFGNATMDWAIEELAGQTYKGDVTKLVQHYATAGFATNALMAQALVHNLVELNNGGSIDAALKADLVSYVTSVIDGAGAGNQGAAIVQIVSVFSTYTAHPVAAIANAAMAFNSQITAAIEHASTDGTIDGLVHPPVVDNTLFSIVDAMAAGASVMRLSGNQDVRIDFTNPDHQIKGLDLDGDGTIENDEKENNPAYLEANDDVVAAHHSGYVVVDAHSRNPLNHSDAINNFLGDIYFDGTGFDGDGTNTDGNIVLGGLGADIILGGIGNDFFAGGGVATSGLNGGNTGANTGTGGQDRLDGGRNADFFFAELSLLDPTDGNRLTINAGSTTDDSAVGNNTPQDTDWLLIQASDDEDGTRINLTNENSQSVVTGAGTQISSMTEIENVDASGNLYGFLDDFEFSLGGGMIVTNADGTTENVGLGSSAQLWITGSDAANRLIGGFDNDRIEGGNGADLLMGGNLHYLNDPNLQGILNDGMDELSGGTGNDNIVFEADKGIINGGDDSDTLWLTDLSLGKQTASAMLSDGILRFDLQASTLANAAGYGGADVDGTQDQTKYKTTTVGGRVTVTNMESVIATGMGAIDYLASGANPAEDLAFRNQQNHFAYTGSMHLRGTSGVNTLYASDGDDVIEGREGNDKLSGGGGTDDFVFWLQNGSTGGDGLDVIHRQHDKGNNLTDGTFDQDFGLGGSQAGKPSNLVITIGNTAPTLDVRVVSFYVNGTLLTVSNVTATLGATMGALADALEAGLNTQAPTGITFTVTETNTAGLNGTLTITATPAAGSTTSPSFAKTVGGTFNSADVIVLASTNASQFSSNSTEVRGGVQTSADRIIFAAYEDRADGELVDDDGMVNSTGDAVTLGARGYAEDLVVRFKADAKNTTVLAESQLWTVVFTNLADEDSVTISVNGTSFKLTMGVAPNGTAIEETQDQFVARIRAEINSVADRNTLAGTLVAGGAGSTLTLDQGDYNGGEDVFMDKPVVTLGNGSGGEPASVTITNNTASEVTLYAFDGQNNKLNADNVLFLGGAGMDQGVVTNAANSRAVLATALATGSTLTGKDALVLDSMTDVDTVATDFSLHGDDYLIGGDGNDVLIGGTGDDRFEGSRSTLPTGDSVNGGKDLYVVRTQNGASVVETVELLNTYEAAQRRDTTLTGNASVLDVSFLEEDAWNGTADGFADTLVFNQTNFNAGTDFYITVGLAGDANILQRRSGGQGTVAAGDFNSATSVFTTNQGITTFSEMEAVRTLSGDGTLAGQGRDTLDLSLVSNAVAGSFATAAAANTAGANTIFHLMSNDSSIDVNADTDNNDADVDPQIDDFLAVAGVENLIGGNANDLLFIDESESRKDNTFTGGLNTATTSTTVAGLVGDQIIYDHSDMLNDGAGNNGSVAEIAARPKITVTIGTTTDTIKMEGGNVGLPSTDTLNDVEGIDLNDAARSTQRDLLTVASGITGVTVDYQLGKVLSGGAVLVDIGDITELEDVIATSGNDTFLPADTMTNANAVAWTTNTAIAGNPDFNNGFTFFRGTTLNSIAVANQGLFSINFTPAGATTDTGSDTLDFRAESNQDIAVVVDLVNTGINSVDRVVVANGDIDVDANLTSVNARVDVYRGADRFYAGNGDGGNDSIIDLSQHATSSEVTVTFSPNVVADENARLIDIRVSGTSIAKQFIDDSLTAGERADATGNTTQEAYWNRIEGNNGNETINLTDYVSGHNMTYNLRGGVNVVNYNPATIGTNLQMQNVAGDATSQTMLIGTTDKFGSTATHTATGSVGSVRVQGSSVGTDYIDMSAVSVPYTIVLNLQEGAGEKGEIRMSAVDSNLDGDTTDAGDFQAVTTTVAGYENIAGNNANNNYTVSSQTNAVYMGNGNDTLTVGKAEDLAGDTIVGDSMGSLAATQAAVIAGTLNAANMDDGNDTIVLTGALTSSTYTFNMGAGTADQFTGGIGSSADVFGFENVDASGSTNTSAIFNLTSSTQSKSTLKGGAGNDTLVAVVSAATAQSVLDGGAGADTMDFGADANGVMGVWEFGDSNSASADTVTNFTSGTDDASVMVDMTARGLTNVSASFATGVTAGRVLTSGVVSAYYDTTVQRLLVDMNANGINDSTGDLTIGSATAVAAGDVHFIIAGTSAANTITGAGGDDMITGGGGNDTLDGGQVAEVLEQHTFTISNPAGGAGETIIIDGVTITEGLNIFGTVVANNDADAIGTAFERVWANNPNAFTNVANISSVTYNQGTNALTFTFTSAAQNTVVIGAAAGTAAASVSAETVSVNYAAAQASDDIFVFESTAAANGADTINNFDEGAGGDILDFSAMVNQASNQFASNGAAILATTGFVVLGTAGDQVTGTHSGTKAAAELAAFDAFISANQKFLFAVDNGTDTAIYYYADADGDGAADDGEATLVATLTGVADATTVVAGNIDLVVG